MNAIEIKIWGWELLNKLISEANLEPDEKIAISDVLGLPFDALFVGDSSKAQED